MPESNISRRHFLQMAGAVTLGFSALRYLPESALAATPSAGYGPLIRDPKGIFDLPKGFKYRIISRAGEKMRDGLIVPGRQDGMAAFPGRNGKTILIRNHETAPDLAVGDSLGPFGRRNELLGKVDRSLIYDPGYSTRGGRQTPHAGGTTTLVYDTRTGKLESEFLSLCGTNRNCAGGPTPWNTWISCEETHLKAKTMAGAEGKRYNNNKAHGYNFEVPATDKIGLVKPVPLVAMGRFRHEAVAVDPVTGIVYQTEDRDDGLIYRFIPNVKGQLAKGGKVEALKVKGKPALDTRNWEHQSLKAGQSVEIEWIPCENVNSDTDDLRYRTFERGAARFARGEGMWAGNNSIYFAATSGGKAHKGQIWRIDPHRNSLTLWMEPNNGHIIENADNLTVAPWGDVVLSEDLATWKTRVDNSNWLSGINKRGEVYKIGRNAMNDQELAGVCFSPDGSTLFVNIYHPGMTLAITGPWRG